ncbi:hypothetical protein N431DRAFT_471800 [Stipitochalara longipes BDJ]|nr:hypothetical protein N431DRAFT_471800 [Stipitochalara longipes BDJ]
MADNISPNKPSGREGSNDIASSFNTMRAETTRRIAANWRALHNLTPSQPFAQQNETEHHLNNDQNPPITLQDESKYDFHCDSNDSPFFENNNLATEFSAGEPCPSSYDADHSESTCSPSQFVIQEQPLSAPQRARLTPLSADRAQDLHEALTTDFPGLPPLSTTFLPASNPFTRITTRFEEGNNTREDLKLRGGGTSGEAEDNGDDDKPKDNLEKINTPQHQDARGKKNYQLEGNAARLSTDRSLKPVAMAMLHGFFRSQKSSGHAQKAASASVQSSGELAGEDRDALRDDRGEGEAGGSSDERDNQDERRDEESYGGGRGDGQGDGADPGEGEADESRDEGRDQDEGGSGENQDDEKERDSEDGGDQKDGKEDENDESDQEEEKKTPENTDGGDEKIDNTIVDQGDSSGNQVSSNDVRLPDVEQEMPASGPTNSSMLGSGNLPPVPPSSPTSHINIPSFNNSNGHSPSDGNLRSLIPGLGQSSSSNPASILLPASSPATPSTPTPAHSIAVPVPTANIAVHSSVENQSNQDDQSVQYESAEDESADGQSNQDQVAIARSAQSSSMINAELASPESTSGSEQANTLSTDSALSPEPGRSNSVNATTSSPDNGQDSSSPRLFQDFSPASSSTNLWSQLAEASDAQPSILANETVSTTTGNTQTPQASTPVPVAAPTLLPVSQVYHLASSNSSKSPSSSESKVSPTTAESGWVPNPTNFGINKHRCPMCVKMDYKRTCSGGPPCDACARLGYNARQCQTGDEDEDGGGRHERPGRKRGKKGGGGMSGADFAGTIVV